MVSVHLSMSVAAANYSTKNSNFHPRFPTAVGSSLVSRLAAQAHYRLLLRCFPSLKIPSDPLADSVAAAATPGTVQFQTELA